MKIASALLGGLFCAFLIAFAAPPATVNITLASGGRVTVSPDRVELGLGGQLRWLSSGESGARIEIEFGQASGKKGPFPEDRGSGNPSRGRYKKNVGSPIVTRAADATGTWKYTVTWIAADGSRHVLDPVVVVRR